MSSCINIFLVLLFAINAARGGLVIYEDCGSEYEIDSVDIAGCERTIPCYLSLGSSLDVMITYTAGYVSRNLTQEATIILNSIHRDTPVSPQACEATWCPVRVQTSSVYRARMEIPTNMATNTRGHLHWRIVNENTSVVICFTVTIQTRTPADIGEDIDEILSV